MKKVKQMVLKKVIATGLNLRVYTGISSDVLAVLPFGHVVEIIDNDKPGSWLKVKTTFLKNEIIGFVYSKYLADFRPVSSGVENGLIVSKDSLNRFCPNAKDYIINGVSECANDVLSQYEINDNGLRLTCFLAQIAHESAGLRVLSENLNYSSGALRRVFPSRFTSDEIANFYEMEPERIANVVYANRIGNGSVFSGDGWLYRGRGLIQLTGKDNYIKYGKITGIDLVQNPEIAEKPENALNIAAAYWFTKGLNDLADKKQFRKITRLINGGYNGHEDRLTYLRHARSIWG